MKKSLLTVLLLSSIIVQLSARVYSVNSLASFNSAMSQASANDIISWKPGTYGDVNMIITKNNIVVKAEVSGETIFNGTSKLLVSGDANSVDGLQFIGGRIESGNVIESRGVNNYFSNIHVKDYTASRFMTIKAEARYNTFSYCTFDHRVNDYDNNIVQINISAEPNHAAYHVFSHCQFKNFDAEGNGGDYGVEAIRIGLSSQKDFVSRTTVEYCYFTQCNGDAEIISSKSTENIYRYNTFEDNPYSQLELRHGSSAIVYGNFFLNGYGGIKIWEGDNHCIYNNYCIDTKADGIVIRNRNINTPKNVYIAHNTLVNSSLGLGGATDKNDGLEGEPTNVVVANNLVSGENGNSRNFIKDLTGQETFISNVLNGWMSTSNVEGITEADPQLVKNGEGFYDLSSGSPVIDMAKESGVKVPAFIGLEADYAIELDIIKTARPSDVLKKDIGAQEYMASAMVKPHATLANTGAKYLQSGGETAIRSAKGINKQVSMYPNPTKQSFTIQSEGEDISNVFIYSISGTLVYQSNVQGRALTINEQLNSGIYLVRVTRSDASVETQHLMVE